MRYRLMLEARAEATYRALTRPLRVFVGEHMLDLADAPASLGRPTVSPPYPPGGLVYEFNFDPDPDAETFHHFAVFFRYGRDEMTLHIETIGHSELLREV